MDFGKLYFPCVVSVLLLICGCSDSGQYVDYSTLNAAEPDFVSNGTTDFSGGSAVVPTEEISTDTSKVEQPATSSTAETSNPAKATTSQPNATSPATSQPVLADAGPPVVDSTAAEVTDTDTESESNSDTNKAIVATAKGDDAATAKTVDSLDPDEKKSTEPLEIKLLVKDKRFRSEDDSLRVSYDDIDLLKVLNMEPVPVDAPKHFPEWLKALDGKRIRIRGFMYPTFEATGLKGFTLARDNGICCFVRQPMIYDIIGVDMAEGTTTKYIDNKPFDVEGVFQIVPEADDTELFQLYRIADAKVLN